MAEPTSLTVTQALQMGLDHHRAGRRAEAESIYRQVLTVAPRHADALHLLGVITHQAGQHESAIALMRQALAEQPTFPSCWNNLGLAHKALAQRSEAIACFRSALEQLPDFADAMNNCANVLRDDRQWAEALEAYRRVLTLRPDYPEAALHASSLIARLHGDAEAVAFLQNQSAQFPKNARLVNQQGIIQQRMGAIAVAETCFRRALRIDAAQVEAHNNLGAVLQMQGRADEAHACFLQVLSINPHQPTALFNLGLHHQNRNEFDQAQGYYVKALAHGMAAASVHINLGIVAKNLGDLDAARRHCEEALRHEPDRAEAHNNLGNIFRLLGRDDEALASFDRALRSQPENAELHFHRALPLVYLGKESEAIASFDEALRRNPHASEYHFNRALALLATEDFARGLPEFEYRSQRPGPVGSEAQWRGEPLAGKTILLRCEQGLGDTLMFVRFAAVLQGRGARVICEVQPELAPLLTRCTGIDSLVAKGTSIPPHDFYLPMMSLLGVLDHWQTSGCYLHADETRVAVWRDEVKALPGLKVGIAWQGNRRYMLDGYRSISLAHFEALARVPNLTLVSLQKFDGVEQLARNTLPIVDFGDRLDETGGAFMDSAAIMRSLDLVIASDSALVHLAGGLGVPVWMPTSFVPDWRWFKNTETSRWYPSLRLFRQTQLGRWDDVFARMAEAVGVLARVQ